MHTQPQIYRQTKTHAHRHTKKNTHIDTHTDPYTGLTQIWRIIIPTAGNRTPRTQALLGETGHGR